MFRHLLGCGLNADRVHGLERPRGDARQLPHASARDLGFQIPQRTVECIAGAAGRQETLQSLTVDACDDGVGYLVDLRAEACRRFAEIENPECLTPTDRAVASE